MIQPVLGAYQFGDGKTNAQKLAGSILGITDSNTTLETRIGGIIGAALAFVGAVFMILIIYGGILWMTAGGNEDKVKKARQYIINATIGLVIVILANIIVYFIIFLAPGETLPSEIPE